MCKIGRGASVHAGLQYQRAPPLVGGACLACGHAWAYPLTMCADEMPPEPPMTEAQAQDMVTALLTASRLLLAISARSIASVEEDLTIPQFRLLVCLKVRGPLTVTDLAAELQVKPSSAHRLADRIMNLGHVTRVHESGSIVALTPKGSRLVERVWSVRAREIAAIVDRMPDGESETLIRALRKFTDAGGEPPAVYVPNSPPAL